MSTAEPIRIDDLRDPVLTDVQRAAVDYARSLSVSFEEDALLDDACRRTGLSDFGPDDFRARLRATLDAIDADAGLGPLGRFVLHQRTVRLLVSRLLVEDLLRRHPEIHDVEIERPIIVVGLPRSGTTHLVNLIAADTRLRSLPFWESLEPIPMRGDGPGRDGLDARFIRCRRGYEAQMAMVPLLRAMHHQHPSAIEEEIELQDLDFSSYTLEWLARVPGWRDYYLALDQRPRYAYLKKVLQALTFLRGPSRWVLKSPQHLEQLGPLMETFPDATVAVTHRDPVSVISSAITMLAYGDRVRRDRVEPEQLGEYWIDRVERLLRACVRDRELLPAERSIDVIFDEFIADDVGMVARIYERAGIELTDKARRQFDVFMAENPRGKHGRVVYDLRGDFGFDPAEVRGRFGFYFDRLPVRAEVDA